MPFWSEVYLQSPPCAGPVEPAAVSKKRAVRVNTEGALMLEAWKEALPLDDPQRHELLHGIEHGFRIINQDYDGHEVWEDNYSSATDPKNFDKVEAQILAELANGRYVRAKVRPKIISALGAIPKPDSDKIRLIHDCSRPHGQAVNDYAINDSFSYQSIEDAVEIITPNCYLLKLDLSQAYRSVKISCDDHQVSGLAWTFKGDKDPTVLIDTRLPFGARLAPAQFNKLTQAVRRIMSSRGFNGLICYLDDFLIIAKTADECRARCLELIKLLRSLGFAINYNKVVGPAKQLTFLGVEIDTEEGVLRLPREKMSALLSNVKQLLLQRSVSKRQLQSLAGQLSWSSQVVHGGRPHLRRVLDRINCLKGPSHRTRITQDIRKDLAWWMHFGKTFNGALPMLDKRPAVPVCIDACLEAGGGFSYDGSFFHLPWSHWPGASEKCINYKEVLTLEPAANLFAPLWANKRVYVYSDNKCAVALINKGTAKDAFVMDSLRRVFWLSAIWNFKLVATYYPGRQNVVADACSRLHEPGAWDRLQSALACTFLH